MITGKGHKVLKNNIFKKSFPKYFEKLKKKYGSGKIGNHLHPPEKPKKNILFDRFRTI